MMFYVHCVFILFASSRLMMAPSSLLTAANYLAVVTALIHVEIPLSYSLLSLKFVPNYRWTKQSILHKKEGFINYFTYQKNFNIQILYRLLSNVGACSGFCL